jgi:hypothetical protein
MTYRRYFEEIGIISNAHVGSSPPIDGKMLTYASVLREMWGERLKMEPLT